MESVDDFSPLTFFYYKEIEQTEMMKTNDI